MRMYSVVGRRALSHSMACNANNVSFTMVFEWLNYVGKVRKSTDIGLVPTNSACSRTKFSGTECSITDFYNLCHKSNGVIFRK